MEKLFFTNNKTTGIDVAQARGVLLLAASQAGLDIHEYTPVQVKQGVVGYGKAEKKQVMEMTRVILNLPEVPKPDDTADALALAICHAHVGGSTLGSLESNSRRPLYSITGELVYADPNMAAVNVNGIAFQCDISLNTFQHLGSNGSTVTLYTYMNFKQDGVDLLGFYDRSEVDAFKMLTGVSGVGPKAALAILSEMDPAKLTLAIAAGDYKAITRAKGVGPKAAQRIVLELKDKVAKGLEGGNASDTFVAAATATAAGNSNAADAVGALVMLGYSQSEAAIAVGKLDQTLSTEELIKQALKQLA